MSANEMVALAMFMGIAQAIRANPNSDVNAVKQALIRALELAEKKPEE